jgi:pimeloyl-ACP methyl ester carboxylesterase
MRGYAPTEIPSDARFHASDLAGDVVALHDALGGDGRAVLIAHDWGAVAAYGGAARDPARWRRCVVMNVPPLAVYGQIGLRYEQIKRSFYFWFFQMQVAEAIVAADDLAFLDGLWRDWSPGYDAREDLPRVKACLRDPANLRAALGYYRAFFDPARFGSPEAAEEQAAVLGRPMPQPTLYLHGTQDGCIALDAAAAKEVAGCLAAGSEVERVEGVGHFMLVEKPAEVNRRILRFLERDATREGAA